MQPCQVCGKWACSCDPLGATAGEGALTYGPSTVTLPDGRTYRVEPKFTHASSTREEDVRRTERFGKAVLIVANELAQGRAVMRGNSEQAVMVFGDPYTLRCFPATAEDHRPGEVLVPLPDKTPHVLYALRAGYPIKLEGPYCRWCAGDGIDHRHSNRVRALFERDQRIHARSGIRVIPGVAKGRPFNDWLREMQEAALPLDEIFTAVRRSEAELRCRRCMGSGR